MSSFKLFLYFVILAGTTGAILLSYFTDETLYGAMFISYGAGFLTFLTMRKLYGKKEKAV